MRLNDLGAPKLDCRIGRDIREFDRRTAIADNLVLSEILQGCAIPRRSAGRRWSGADGLRALAAETGFHRNDTFVGMGGSSIMSADEPVVVVGLCTDGPHGEPSWSTMIASSGSTIHARSP